MFFFQCKKKGIDYSIHEYHSAAGKPPHVELEMHVSMF